MPNHILERFEQFTVSRQCVYNCRLMALPIAALLFDLFTYFRVDSGHNGSLVMF